MAQARIVLFAIALALLSAPSLAGQGAPQAPADEGDPKADGHGPAGVMFDHMHKAGEFMIGYRFNWSKQSGDMLNGTTVVDEHDILHDACQNEQVTGHEHCMMQPTRMTMKMHMLDLMYAPTNRLTLMVMPQWMTMDMSMDAVDDPDALPGDHDDHGADHMGSHSHSTGGFGDTTFGALVKLVDGQGHYLHAGLMFSAPTGSTSETDDGQLTHYMMQLGSGTWDFLPNLTYTGRADRWSWGAQLSGVVRMEDENGQGYRLGNVAQTTAWGSYRLADWMSASVRFLSASQGDITGLDHTGMGTSPPDLATNYGGRFYDLGFGVNTVVTSGALAGHRLSAEWLAPVRDDVNGYQLRRTGALVVNWSKAF